MKNNTAAVLSIALMIIGILLFIWMVIFLLHSNEITKRTVACAEEGMTYIHITMIEGIPAKIDYCGNISDIINYIESMRNETKN